MKTSNRTVGFTLALLISVGIISGCSTQLANVPSNTSVVSTADTVSLQGSATAVQIQDSLISIQDDEMTFSDSENILNSEVNSSFGVKAVEIEKPEATPSASPKPLTVSPKVIEARTNAAEKLAEAKAKAAERAAEAKARLDEAKVKLQERIDLAKANAAKMKEQFEKSGAVKVNADGTFTINPKLLKEEAEKAAKQVKANAEKQLEVSKNKLEATKELAKQEVEKLQRKNNIVRKSDVVKTVNADESTTYTTTVNFTNEKAGITRKIIVSKTLSKDGKLIKIEHSFNMTTPNFTRIGTRLVTINADGSRNVKTQITTTWKDGGKREVNEERIVAADKTATGNGTVTITSKDGTVKTYNLNLSITASGEVTSTAKDIDGKTEISVDGKADGTATAIVKEDGKEETAEKIVIDSAADASAKGTLEATPSPSPSASPAA